MTNSLSYLDWIETIRSEYLNTFVRDGGSAIKFAVPLEEGIRPLLFQGVIRVADDLGYLTAEINSKETKVHMMHEVFFKIAEQIDWKSLARNVISKLAIENGYALPSQEDEPILEGIAAESGIDATVLRGQLNRQLSEKVFKHRGLAKDFRVAMVQICMAILSGGADGTNTVQVLTDWLTGRNRRVGAVKPFVIYSTINRTNARHMFESLLN